VTRDREDGFGVGDLAGFDHPLDLIEREGPVFGDLIADRSAGRPQRGGEEESDPLVREPGRREEGAGLDPVVRYEPGLLAKLTLGAGERFLAGLELPGRDLPQLGSDRMAVLANEKDLMFGDERDDGCSARMMHELTIGSPTAGQFDLIDGNVDQASAEDRFV